MEDKTKEIITSKKAAKKLGIDEEKVIALIKANKLKGFLVDGEYKTTMTALDDFRKGPFAYEIK